MKSAAFIQFFYISVFLAALPGCAFEWRKAGMTEATRQKDTTECAGIASRSYSIVTARHKARPRKSRRGIDNRIVTDKRLPPRSSEISDAFIECMESRGYKQERISGPDSSSR